MAAPEGTNLLTRLWKYGELPTVDTAVTVDKSSIYTAGAALFIAAFLIILTWYTFKKLA